MATAQQNLILKIKAFDGATPQMRILRAEIRKVSANLAIMRRAQMNANLAIRQGNVAVAKATVAKRGWTRAIWYATQGLRGLAGALGIVFGWVGILASALLVLGAGFFKATVAFAKFEYQMLYVKNLAQLSSTAYENLSNHIRRIARFSIHTTQQLAKLAVEMAKAGLSGDQIDRAIKPTANFAVANFIEPGEAARIAINTLNQFGMGIDRIKEVTGTLTYAVNKSTITISNFAESMKYLGPRAQLVGDTLQETSAIIAHLGNVGLRGGRATRALATALVRLQRHSKAFEKIGVNLFDSKGKRTGTFAFLTQLSTRLKQIGEATGLEDLHKDMKLVGTIFDSTMGAESLAAILSLYKSVIGDQKLFDLYEGISKSSVQQAQNVAKLTEALTNSTWGNILKMQSAFQELAVAMGKQFAPAAIQLTQGLTRFMNNLSWIFGGSGKTGVSGGKDISAGKAMLTNFTNASALGKASYLMPGLLIPNLVRLLDRESANRSMLEEQDSNATWNKRSFRGNDGRQMIFNIKEVKVDRLSDLAEKFPDLFTSVQVP